MSATRPCISFDVPEVAGMSNPARGAEGIQ
jgi:hypothetical protein